MSNTDINNIPSDLVSSIISEMEARAKQVDYQRDEPILKFPVKEETQVVAGEQRIGLPEKISAGKAAKILNEYEQAQQEEVRVVRQFKARYEDMLVATSVIMEARWGFTGRGQKQMSFFGGAQPPVAEDVTIGLDEKGFPITKTVIASSFSFEPLSASIDFGYHSSEKLGMCGMISVEGQGGRGQDLPRRYREAAPQRLDLQGQGGRVQEAPWRQGLRAELQAHPGGQQHRLQPGHRAQAQLQRVRSHQVP